MQSKLNEGMKEYIGKAKYIQQTGAVHTEKDRHVCIVNTGHAYSTDVMGQFITDAINEKLTSKPQVTVKDIIRVVLDSNWRPTDRLDADNLRTALTKLFEK